MPKMIPLTKDKFAIVDDNDYERVAKYNWQAQTSPRHHTYYAKRDITVSTNKRELVLMHRFILGLSNYDPEVDHINRNGLDNRKCNIRLSNRRQQRLNSKLSSNNTSGFVGVKRALSSINPWRAEHTIHGKRYHIGLFPTAEEASKAREEFVERIADLHRQGANLREDI